MPTQQKLIFLAGPTGVGKTELSLDLAIRFNAEIISMDSMQIYRGMDIGTAKASREEQKTAAHHLIDICEVDSRFTVQDYQQLAYEKIEEIRSRGKQVLFVGGTGLYLDAVSRGYRFAGFDRDTVLRQELSDRYDAGEADRLYLELSQLDTVTASILTPADKKKIIRALEVYHLTGIPLSRHKEEEDLRAPKDNLIIVLYRPREDLYRRINQRVLMMLEEGLIEENIRLSERKLPPSNQAIQAIGYREVQDYLRGLMTREEMVRLLQQNSRNYAKRQLTWFRKNPAAHWIDVNNEHSLRQIEDLITDFLKGNE